MYTASRTPLANSALVKPCLFTQILKLIFFIVKVLPVKDLLPYSKICVQETVAINFALSLVSAAKETGDGNEAWGWEVDNEEVTEEDLIEVDRTSAKTVIEEAKPGNLSDVQVRKKVRGRYISCNCTISDHILMIGQRLRFNLHYQCRKVHKL